MKDSISRDYKPLKGIASFWGNAPVFAILLVWSLFSLFSLFWIVSTSLKSDYEFTSGSPWALPGKSIPLAVVPDYADVEKLTDGDKTTVWKFEDKDYSGPPVLAFRLREPEKIEKITLYGASYEGSRKYYFPADRVRFFFSGLEIQPLGEPDISSSGLVATYRFSPYETDDLKIEVRTAANKVEPFGSVEIAEIAAFRPNIRLQWINYKLAWTLAKMGQYTMNSVIVTCCSVVFIVIISAMSAYAITKLEWKGSQLFFYYFLSGMAMPASLILVPLFMFLKNFNIEQLDLFPLAGYWLISIRDFYLVDSRLGLILIYTSLGLPFTTFVLSGFFRTLPSALAEAAAIDGASEYQVFWKIFLPLAKPGLVTVSIFNFLYAWNEYQFALVFISNPKIKTLPLGLYSLSAATRHSTNWTALFAGLVILMLPTIAVFVFLEDRITKGLTVGAVKE